MGSLFSKKKSRVTDQDVAVLHLKAQRDKLLEYQKRIEKNIEKDRELIKKCIASKRKDRARMLLKKRKFLEQKLAESDAHIESMAQLTTSIEFAQVQGEIIKGMKQGTKALEELHAVLKLEDIVTIFAEAEEGIAAQQELDEFISGAAFTPADEEDILGELQSLVDEDNRVEVEKNEGDIISEMAKNLPNVPVDEPEDVREKKQKEKSKAQRVALEA